MGERKKHVQARSIAEKITQEIEAGGERLWRMADFENLSSTATAQTLSRLSRRGFLERLGKGIYYRPRETSFGKSKAGSHLMRSLPIQGRGVFPSGDGAANYLGFTSQNPARIELSTTGLSLPRLIIGKNAIVHTRRPEAWKKLSPKEAAILDFIRDRGKASELSPSETVAKLFMFFQEPDQFKRLLSVVLSEPPRVRAILGAIGQQLGYSSRELQRLRKSLNPLSRFDFGNLASLKFARDWQAKK